MSESSSEREARLMLENMGLVVSISKRFRPSNDQEAEDFKQIASIGLLKAIRTFNGDRAALSTWVHRCIVWELMRYVKKRPSIKTVSSGAMYDIEDIYNPTILAEYLPDNITEDEKKIIDLRCSNRSVKEISIILDIPPYQIGKLLKSAVDKIVVANEEKNIDGDRV